MKIRRKDGEDIPRDIAGLLKELDKLSHGTGGGNTSGVDGFAPVDTVRALLNACTEIAFVLDTKGRFVAVNETCETWFGKTGAELMGRVALELIPPELAENRVKIILDVISTGSSRRFEDVNRGRIFDNHLYPVTGADGNVAGVAVFARDITAERLEKEELARKTREFDRIFQAIPDLYFRMDKDGVFLDYRASNESLLFRPPGEFIGKKLLDVLPLEAGEAIYQSIRDVIRTKHEKTLKYTLPLPHGMVWFEARILPADRGEVVAVVRDVTGMRKAEERARSNEARFQAIAAAVQDALVVVDDTGVVTFWNAAAERVFGYTEQEVLGEKIHGLLTVDLDPVFMEGRFRVFAASGGGPVIGRTVEMVMRRKNGELFPAELSISSFRMDGRHYAVGTARDIAGRKRAEDSLRASEEQYRLLVEHQTDVIVQTDLDGRFTYVSPTYCRMFGKKEEDLLGRSFVPLIHEDDVAVVGKAVADLYNPPYTCYYEERALTADGWRWLGWAARAQFGSDGEIAAFVRTGRDITERKNAAIALRASEENFRLFYERAPIGYQSLDENGNILQVNRAWLDTLGYEERNVLGRWFGDFLESDQAELFRGLFAHMIETGELRGAEIVLRTRFGRSIAARFEGAVVYDAGGNFIRAHGVFQDVTVERNARHILRVQRDLGIAVGTDKNVKGAVNHILDAAVSLEGVDAGGVYLLDRVTGGLTLVAHRGLSPEYVAAVSEAPPDSDYMRIAESGAFFHTSVADLEKKVHSDLFRREGLLAISICPVFHEGLLAAVMNLASRTVEELSPPTRTALEDMAIRIGGVIARVRSDEMVLHAKNEWERTFDTIPDVVTILSPDHTILRANKATAELLGIPLEELIGKKCYELFHQLEAPPGICPHTKLLDDGREHHEEIAEDSLGRIFWVSDTPLEDDTGKLVGSVHVARDITENRRAEEAVRASETRYRAIVDNLSAAVYRWLPDTTLTYVNEWCIKNIAQGDRNVLGERWIERVPEETREVVASAYRELAANPRVFTYEHPVLGEGGDIRWIIWTDVPIFDDKGNLVEFQTVGTDITERKLAEDSIRKSESRYRAIVDNQSVAVCRWLPDTTLTYANEWYIRNIAMGDGTVLGKKWIDCVPEDEREGVASTYRELAANPRIITYEHAVLGEDGSTRWIIWTDVPIFDDKGNLVEFQSVGADITERKRDEEALRLSEKRYREIFDTTPVAIWEYDLRDAMPFFEKIAARCGSDPQTFLADERDLLDGLIRAVKIVDVNDAAVSIYGASSREEMRRYLDGDFFMEMRDVWNEVAIAYFERKESVEIETTNRTIDGQVIDIVIRIAFSGESVFSGHATLTVEDITERKSAEKALRTSEERFRTIFDTVPVAIFEYDFSDTINMLENIRARGIADHRAFLESNPDVFQSMIEKVRLRDVNNEALVIYGASSKEELFIFNESPRSEEIEAWKEAMIAYLDGEKGLVTETANDTVDGRRLNVMVGIAFTEEMKKTGRALVSVLDITERKRALEALRASESRFRSIFETVPVAIWEYDFHEAIGMLEAISQRGITDYRAFFDDNQEMIRGVIETVRLCDMNEEAVLLYGASSKESILANYMGFRPETLDAWKESILAFLEGKTGIVTESPYVTIDGSRLTVVISIAFTEEMKRTGRALVTALDITERKRAEQAAIDTNRELDSVFRALPDLYFRMDMDGTILNFRAGDDQLLLLPPGKFIGGRMQDVMPPEVGERFTAAIRDIRDGLRETTFEYTLDLPVGERIFESRTLPLGEGHVFSMVRDITGRKLAEEALRESEERFRAIFENMTVPVAIVDTEGRWLQANQRYVDLLGYSLEELHDMKNTDVTHPDDLNMTRGYMKRLINGESGHIRIEKRYVHKDGGIVWIDLSIASLRDARGDIGFFLAVSQDITERKQIELALEQSEELLRTVVENAPVMLFSIDREGVFTLSEGRGLSLLGLDPGQLTGASVFDVYRDNTTVLEHMKRALAGEEHTGVVEIGGVVFETGYSPVFDPEGAVSGVIGISTDITRRMRAEHALRESEDRYRRIVDTANEGMWLVDTGGNTSLVNVRMADMLGYSPEEMIGNPVEGFVYPEDLPIFREGFRVSMLGASGKYEMRGVRRDGVPRWFLVSASPITDRDERFTGFFAMFTDITERKEAEAALRLSEERYSLALDAANEGLWDWYLPSGNAHFSPRYSTMLGYEPGEFPATFDYWKTMVHPDDIKASVACIEEGIREKRDFIETEFRIKSKSGEWRWIVSRGKVVERDAEGTPIRMVGTHNDITERKRAEKALRESEKRFRAIFENSAVAIGLIDRTGRWREANTAFETMVGYSQEEIFNLTNVELTHPDDRDLTRAYIHALARGEMETVRVEKRYIRKDGGIVWVDLSVKPIRRDDGSIEAYVGVKTDITERKRVEALLRESEERFAFAIDAANEGLWDWDVPSGDAYFSPRYYTMLGYEPNEFPAGYASWKSLLHPDDVRRAERNIRYHFEGKTEGYEAEFRMKTKSGGWMWIYGRGKIVQRDSDGGPVRVVGTHLDITRRKLTEEELRDSEERLATVFREIPTSVSISTIDEGRYLQVNEAFERILGWPPEEVIGRNAFELGIWVDHHDRKAMIETIGTRGAVRNLELQFRAKDGNIKDCFVSAVTIKFREEPCLLVVLNDITEHKREEENRKKLEAQLLQAQKMETVGRLAGGIAHDFNNLLTTIIGNAELSLMTLAVGEPVYEEMVEIKKSADRAASLTRQLLAFSRKQIVEPRVLNLNEVLLDMDKMLRRLIGEHIEYLTLPGADLMRVKVDPGQVEQVITNLVVNSRDAMPEGGKITIETSNVTLGGEYIETHPGSKPGAYVMLAVSDNGTGIEKEICEHIFEPFFTTKELGKGTGLGLPTCYGIVKQNHGTIQVYSEPGKGTTMKVYLPAIDEDAPAQMLKKDLQLPRGTETVLVVEDDSALREMVVRILKGSGYTVIAMPDGRKAIDEAAGLGQYVDMLVTDVIMPRMGGRELANRIVEYFPDIRILYMSGYTDDAIVHHGVLEPGLDFIQKPFTPLALLKKVREVFDK